MLNKLLPKEKTFFELFNCFNSGQNTMQCGGREFFYLNECGLMHLISENMDHREDPAAAADLCRRLPV